jgi:hypothetical protein
MTHCSATWSRHSKEDEASDSSSLLGCTETYSNDAKGKRLVVLCQVAITGAMQRFLKLHDTQEAPCNLGRHSIFID